ncbi:MAG TPA: aldehyde dehydrogenase family protein [Flavitalea sp.]|nr:aldehyde dehydrogenase family protein [Flavitalea sp.]
MKIINPANEETLAELKEDSRESVTRKFNSLKKGWRKWCEVPLKDRIACIARFDELLEKDKDELAETLTGEMGKPIRESYNELNGARARLKYFIQHSEKYLADEWITEDGSTKEKIVYEPLGVIANISAWNYPYLVGINVFIPALIGGNAVLYKPSEYSTLTGLHIQSLLYEAGIPENVFETIIGKGSVGELLLELPLDGYFFTGSYKTGRYIAEKVAPRLVPCQLELGGKDPMYIMDDVQNITSAAGAALEGVVYNNGQSCCAVERIYVHENIYENFVDEYLKQLKKLKTGDPKDRATELGPISRKEQIIFLAGQVQDAVEKGAKLLAGGKPKEGKGYYFEPSVLVNVDHSMKIMTEESFGPIVGIQKVKNDDEAVDLMLDTSYGLTAAVYSSSYERAEKVMKKMNTGTVYWNCCDRVSATLPWSGRGNSGLGSTLSYQGIRAFVQPKAYHLRG